MKHEIIDGIYYRDGKPTLALGVSYYPSFHYAKYDRSAQDVQVNLGALDPIASATLYTVGGELALKVCDNTLLVPSLYAGAFIICEKNHKSEGEQP